MENCMVNLVRLTSDPSNEQTPTPERNLTAYRFGLTAEKRGFGHIQR
jgi:hypothetical protein